MAASPHDDINVAIPSVDGKVTILPLPSHQVCHETVQVRTLALECLESRNAIAVRSRLLLLRDKVSRLLLVAPLQSSEVLPSNI
jgi:hypothetical protein